LELYERFHSELRRFFEINAYNPNVVDDLMQELYLALRKAFPSDELRDAKAYLFRVAWSVLHTANRRAQRELQMMVSIDAPEIRTHVAAQLADDSSSKLTEARWEAIFAELPERLQVVVLRHFRDGCTYQQVADELRCSRSAVKKYAGKVLKLVRRHSANTDESGDLLPRGRGRGEQS